MSENLFSKKRYCFLLSRWRNMPMAFLVLLLTGNLMGQTITIGAGTGNSNGSGSDPVDDYFKSMHYQTVYTAAELTSAGLTPYDELTGLGFSVTESPGTLGNYTVKIGHTSATNASSHINVVMTTVRNAASYAPTVTAEGVYDMLSFNTNFVWNGTDNIVVDVCTGPSNPYASPYGGVRIHSMTNGSRYARSDSADQCGVNTGTTNTNRPNIQFSYIDGAPPSCIAPSGLGAVTTTNSATLNWTSDGSLFDIEWGASGFTQGTGTMIDGTSANPYNLTDLAGATAYEFYVRNDCGVDGTSSWSGPFSFTTKIPGQVGDGGSTSTNFPIYSNYVYNYSQQIYLASELDEVLEDGNTYITKIRFKQVAVGTTSSYNNWTVYIGNTSKTVFSGTTDWIPADELQQVYSGILSFAANSWVEITLSTPFIWDGTSNLVVAVDENTSGYSSSSFASFASGSNRGISYYSDSINPNPSSPPTANYGPNANIAQIQIVASAPPSCAAPTGLSHTQIDLTSAELSWISDGNLFEVKWDEAGFDVDTEGFAISGITETSVEAPGLTMDTEYEFYVRRDCDEDGLSEWTGPYSFSVGYCDSVPTSHDGTGITNVTMGDVSFNPGSVNYYEYVDNTANIAAGTNVTSSVTFLTSYTYDTHIWIDLNNDGIFDNSTEKVYSGESLDLNDTPSVLDTSFPLAADASLGIHKMRIGTADDGQETPDPCYSGTYGVTIDLTVNITAPPSCIAPSGLTLESVAAHEAEFSWSEVDNAEGYDWFVFENGADPETATAVTSGSVTEASVSVSGLTSETDYDFYVQTDCGSEDGVSVLSLKVDFTTTVSCPAPTDLNASDITADSAVLSWTSNGDTFDIEWGEDGFTQTETPNIEDVENDYLLEGLDATTAYDFYVRRDCGDGDMSIWTGPYSFTTMCGAVEIPYTQNFETAVTPAMPACTTVENAGTGNTWQTISGTELTGKYLRYRWNSSNAANTWFYTAGINLQAGTTYEVTYKYKTGGYPENLKVAVGTSASSASMTELLADHPGLLNETAETGQAYFTPNASGTYYFGFNCYSDADQFYLYVDDISVALPEDIVWTAGGEWSNISGPASADDILVAGNLNVGTDVGDLEVNDLKILPSGNFVISTGNTLTVNGTVTNNSASGADGFIIADNANLIQNSEATNQGAAKVQRESNPMIRLDYAMWSSPVVDQNLFGFSPNTVNGVTNYIGSAGRIYIYEGAGGYGNPSPFTADAVMETGIGYLFRAPNNWSASTPASYEGMFTGVPFNGDLDVDTYAGSFTSIGNPYPSNMDADLLMDANSGISTLYFWVNSGLVEGEYTGNNYATYTDLGGTAAYLGGITPTNVIAVGQGFIVETADASVAFDNTMRISNAAGFLNKVDEAEKHRFWLNLSDENNNGLNQILIGYMTGATQGVDHQIDGKMFGYEGNALYNLINEQKFTIQGRALPFEDSDVVPLGFRTSEDGKYYISLDNMDGLFAEGQAIYIKDNSLNLIHDLTASPYQFESVAGEFKNRFEIVYKDGDGTMGTDDLAANGIMIYKNAGNIEIVSENSNIVSVDVFDLQGRRLFSASNIHNSIYRIKSERFDSQVLVVRVKTLDGLLTNKKVVNN